MIDDLGLRVELAWFASPACARARFRGGGIRRFRRFPQILGSQSVKSAQSADENRLSTGDRRLSAVPFLSVASVPSVASRGVALCIDDWGLMIGDSVRVVRVPRPRSGRGQALREGKISRRRNLDSRPRSGRGQALRGNDRSGGRSPPYS